jgi:hypothetical protein
MTVNVYEQYFEAEHEFGGVPRRAALVTLVSDSEAGMISYKAAVSFFPHRDEEDYAVSYDDYYETEVYSAGGRRSKKREKAFLAELPAIIDSLSEEKGAKVFWDRPLREARLG